MKLNPIKLGGMGQAVPPAPVGLRAEIKRLAAAGEVIADMPHGHTVKAYIRNYKKLEPI